MKNVGRTLTGARLSALARCPRQCAYTALNAEGEEPSEQTRRYFDRGHIFEEYVARQFAARYGFQNVQQQRLIPWPLGEGHADLWIEPNRMLVEVVSTVAPTGKILDFKIEQLKLYMHFDPLAELGAVYVVNPSDLRREEVLPVKVTDGDRERFAQMVTDLETAIHSAGEIMPACAAESPNDCRYTHMCPFSEQAWAGWTPPPAEDIPDQAVPILRKLAAIDRSYKGAEAIYGAAKAERDDARDDLLPFLEPGVEYQHEGITVVLTEVKGRETMRLAPARKAGAISPGIEETLAPFLTVGAPSYRWKLGVAADAVLATSDDYGEEPPF